MVIWILFEGSSTCDIFKGAWRLKNTPEEIIFAAVKKKFKLPEDVDPPIDIRMEGNNIYYQYGVIEWEYYLLQMEEVKES